MITILLLLNLLKLLLSLTRCQNSSLIRRISAAALVVPPGSDGGDFLLPHLALPRLKQQFGLARCRRSRGVVAQVEGLRANERLRRPEATLPALGVADGSEERRHAPRCVSVDARATRVPSECALVRRRGAELLVLCQVLRVNLATLLESRRVGGGAEHRKKRIPQLVRSLLLERRPRGAVAVVNRRRQRVARAEQVDACAHRVLEHVQHRHSTVLWPADLPAQIHLGHGQVVPRRGPQRLVLVGGPASVRGHQGVDRARADVDGLFEAAQRVEGRAQIQRGRRREDADALLDRQRGFEVVEGFVELLLVALDDAEVRQRRCLELVDQAGVGGENGGVRGLKADVGGFEKLLGVEQLAGLGALHRMGVELEDGVAKIVYEFEGHK